MKGGSNKALSPGNDIPRGELFQCWTAGGTVLCSVCSTDAAVSAPSLYTQGGVGGALVQHHGGPGSTP